MWMMRAVNRRRFAVREEESQRQADWYEVVARVLILAR